MPLTPNRKIVACLGSSSTAGKGQAFDWIAELRRRPSNARFEFRNWGVGGDLAYNAVTRLPEVIAADPTKVIVWIGANDVLALVSPKVRRLFRFWKRLPCEPSPDWFRKSLVEIVHMLRSEMTADVGLCSLPPLGEDLNSSNTFQHELNRRVEEYSGIIADIAREQGTRYIPLHEAIAEEICRSPGQALTAFRFLPFYRDAYRALVLRQSPDEIGRRNGWHFHSDGVHLNGVAGRIVADRVQEFLDA